MSSENISSRFYLYDETKFQRVGQKKCIDLIRGSIPLPDYARKLVLIVHVFVFGNGNWRVESASPIAFDETGRVRDDIQMARLVTKLGESTEEEVLKTHGLWLDIQARRCLELSKDPSKLSIIQGKLALSERSLGRPAQVPGFRI